MGDPAHDIEPLLQAQRALSAASVDASAAYRVIAENVLKVVGADGAAVQVFDGAGLRQVAASGSLGELRHNASSLIDSFSRRCFQGAQPHQCDDTEADQTLDSESARLLGARSLLAVPLCHRGRMIGVVVAVAGQPGAFDAPSAARLRLLAGMLGPAISGASDDSDKQKLNAERVTAMSSMQESEARFRAAFDYSSIGMALVGLDGRWLKVNCALCGILGYSEAELLATSVQALTHPNDRDDRLSHASRLLAGEVNAYQLSKRYVNKSGQDVWAEANISLVRDGKRPLYFMAQIHDVSGPKRAQWLEEDRSQALEMVAKDRPLLQVVTQLTQLLERQTDGTAASIMLLRNGALQQVAPHLPVELLRAIQPHAISIAARICAYDVGSQAPPLAVGDLQNDPSWASVRAAATKHNFLGCWTLPVRSADGTFLALITVFLPRLRPPIKHELEVMHTAAKLLTIAIEHFQVTKQLEHLAQHDSLTGLANRVMFESRLQQALQMANRDDHCAAIMAVDLDHFKAVNDTLGHAAGDALLQQFGRRLRDVLRDSDTVARVGGDEFSIILPKINEPADAVCVAKKIVEALSRPFLVMGHELRITGSLGIAVYPNDADDAGALQQFADLHLYRVKRQGRNGFSIATPEMKVEVASG